MCAVRKSVLLINAGRFSLAAALALVITAGVPGKVVDSPSRDGLDLAGLAGNVVLAILGINDAMAKPPSGGGGGGGGGGAGGGGAGGGAGGGSTGGFKAGCSQNLTSNSPNSVKECDRIAVFTLCESQHSGEAGREIVVLANGLTAINKIRCD